MKNKTKHGVVGLLFVFFALVILVFFLEGCAPSLYKAWYDQDQYQGHYIMKDNHEGKGFLEQEKNGKQEKGEKSRPDRGVGNSGNGEGNHSGRPSSETESNGEKGRDS